MLHEKNIKQVRRVILDLNQKRKNNVSGQRSLNPYQELSGAVVIAHYGTGLRGIAERGGTYETVHSKMVF
jgi:hypothetical protein